MIEVKNLSKRYETRDGSVDAVKDVSFQVQEGEICMLLGPSGCGKTTTLKMINRLIPPTSGQVMIAGRNASEMDTVTLRRSIGYVIQQVGLFPNMTVCDNICVVPDLLGWDKKKSRQRAAELLEVVALDPSAFLQRYPRELSGGQQQRVGVARALAADPPVMLMDEPFGAIDPINRETIQDEFMRIQRKMGKTVLFVSHDIDEAVKMADRVAIFKDGKIEQFGTPDDLLARPVSDFVADFMGDDRLLRRLRLMDAGQLVRSVPGIAGLDDLAQGPNALRVNECDDLRQVLSLLLARNVPYAICVDEQQRAIGAISKEHILAWLMAPVRQEATA